MNQLEAMQIYVRVADLASFTQAAESMGIAKASVSAAVRQLEGVLGTRLLHRTTRKVQMTQDGQVFYERCKDCWLMLMRYRLCFTRIRQSARTFARGYAIGRRA